MKQQSIQCERDHRGPEPDLTKVRGGKEALPRGKASTATTQGLQPKSWDEGDFKPHQGCFRGMRWVLREYTPVRTTSSGRCRDTGLWVSLRPYLVTLLLWLSSCHSYLLCQFHSVLRRILWGFFPQCMQGREKAKAEAFEALCCWVSAPAKLPWSSVRMLHTLETAKCFWRVESNSPEELCSLVLCYRISV